MILVTGGAGYVGAHTCKALRRAGYTPVVFDNLSTGHETFVRWGPLSMVTLETADAVLDAIRPYKIEAVLHFAASAYVGELVTDPQKYYDNNVAGIAVAAKGHVAGRLPASSCSPARAPSTANHKSCPFAKRHRRIR